MTKKEQSTITLDELFNYKPTRCDKIKWFFGDALSLPSEIRWWFRYRFVRKHQYHKLDTGFAPGYCDPCVSVPAALFEECSRFVERTEDVINWEIDTGHHEAWNAFKSARDFWRGGYGERFGTDEFDYSDEAKELLCGIINHVEFMWYP